MKKLITKSLILLFIILCSCSNNKMETILISDKYEYWRYENICGSNCVYFKFKSDGTYDKYNRYLNDEFVLFNKDGDLVESERTWVSKTDSTLTLKGFEYGIENFNDNRVVLIYLNDKKKKCKIILTKVTKK